MGAWGYNPKDSDAQGNLRHGIDKVTNKHLEEVYQKYKGYDYKHEGCYEFAGLILDLLQNGRFIKYKYIYFALYAIETEITNTKQGNKSGWHDPKRLVREASFLAKHFQKILDEEKKFYLTTKILRGKRLTGKSMKYRLSKLQNSTMLVPKNWLMRPHELKKDKLFEDYEAVK